jgi:hypothetical protein
MIARLATIAREIGIPNSAPAPEIEDPRDKAARLYERALNINLFTVSNYKK